MAALPGQGAWSKSPARAVAPSTLSIIGRYILHPSVFEHLDKQIKGAGNEIQLTDAIARDHR